MKCDDCLNLLETHVDGEATEHDSDQVRMHLAKCSSCEAEFEALTAETEMYARYDRELQVSPALWNGIAARIAEDRQTSTNQRSNFGEWLSGLFAIPSLRFAMPTLALIAIAVVVGLAYWKTRPQPQPTVDRTARATGVTPSPTRDGNEVAAKPPDAQSQTPRDDRQGPARFVAANFKRPTTKVTRSSDQSDVLPDTDPENSDLETRDTASHLEQAQNLLTSFRNIKYSDTDEEVDVSFEKAESKRLLSENVLLRRDAEQTGKFPAKAMLGSLEPFLIDIANLPDKAKPADVREITDRVQRTEIVAELRGY